MRGTVLNIQDLDNLKKNCSNKNKRVEINSSWNIPNIGEQDHHFSITK
jgi:hypothetical protein